MSSALRENTAPGARAWRGLGARLALWYAFVTLATFAIVAVVFAQRTGAWVEREGQRSADSLLESYRQALEAGGVEALRTLVLRSPGNPSLAVRVTDEQHAALLDVSSDEASRRIATTLRTEGAVTRPRETPATWHTAVAQISSRRELAILVHDDEAPRRWSEARTTLLLILGLGLGSAMLGAFALSHRALRPLSDLARASQRIVASGDLSLRVPERGASDDLARLGALFNRMLARNEALVRAMRESLDNVAHDLRTPLTRLRTGAEVALHGPLDVPRAMEALADVLEESDRVLGMLTTLMDISEAEAGAMHLDRRVEDLGDIAREAVDLYDLVASERGVHVVANLARGVEVYVDRRRILQACANLVDNAIKYTPAGGRVEITVTGDETLGRLLIADTGIGIAAEDLPRVWDRLFRGDRSRAERGLGLGLSLVKAVVEAHGGTVGVRSREGADGGTLFEVALPGIESRGTDDARRSPVATDGDGKRGHPCAAD